MSLLRKTLTSLLLLVLFPFSGNKIHHHDDKSSFKGLSPVLRCVMDLREEGEATAFFSPGINYDMLANFGKSHNDSTAIFPAEDNAKYFDSLANGSVDILLIPSSSFRDTISGISGMTLLDTSMTWVMKTDRKKSRELVRWFVRFRGSNDYQDLIRRFSTCYSPGRNGWNSSACPISPYDGILKREARTLGWDWRLLAALAWSESKFQIQARSPKGALGIMQMMPVTANRFGVTNILDPEQNISAGVKYLSFLKKMLERYTEDPEVLTWLTIAAYNSGGGRALQDLEGQERNKAADSYARTVLNQYAIFGGSLPDNLLGPDGLGRIDPGDEQAGNQEQEHDDNEGDDISEDNHGNVQVDGHEGDEIILGI